MLCYKDMTFCKFYKSCISGKDCFRAYTSHVVDAAERFEMPVSLYTVHPPCYNKIKEDEEDDS